MQTAASNPAPLGMQAGASAGVKSCALRHGGRVLCCREMDSSRDLFRYRLVLGGFIVALVFSGLTAFPLLHELRLLAAMLGIPPEVDYRELAGLRHWIGLVREGLETTYSRYPFIAYGTDWLAFGHLVIALFFIEPWRRPGTCQGNLVIGMVACVAIVPLALICGGIRGIPFYWRLIDCSFGVIGILPLIYCWRVGLRIVSVNK